MKLFNINKDALDEIDGVPFQLEKDIQRMREIRERVRLGPSTGSNRTINFIG